MYVKYVVIEMELLLVDIFRQIILSSSVDTEQRVTIIKFVTLNVKGIGITLPAR